MKRLAVATGFLAGELTVADARFVEARAAVAAGAMVWLTSVCRHPANPGITTARAAARTNDGNRREARGEERGMAELEFTRGE